MLLDETAHLRWTWGCIMGILFVFAGFPVMESALVVSTHTAVKAANDSGTCGCSWC